MNSIASHPDSHDSSQRSLWFGFAAAAGAWLADGFIWQIVTSQACQDGTGDWGLLSGTAVRLLLGAITVALLAVAVAGAFSSYSNWKRLSNDQLVHAEAPGREQFMAFIGMIVGVVFIVGIVWAGLPLVLLDVCIKAR